ncbi:tetratricopeptide repeat protein [Solwaraspora sp. WMMD406]|uniref:tetratricopeptide repeat protein n=1 Tax=Solwaraspora sp. WMMD406 TaxID=3016095 RepID=UPI00241747F7|nr:tetratricopeptide repeat protein [Solwaraspora sp. WMMD406]MDG4763990.1 tetratricopeptide repeat protein [Solwaraspora sp. WMMD406]
MDSHYWISGANRPDRDRILAGLPLPPILARVSAHRRRRGPYTAAGAILRAILPDTLVRRPELGPRHHIEILTAAPEFSGEVPPMRSTLDHRSTSEARTRYQARLHTLRIAHGLVDILRDYLTAVADGPRTLLIDDIAEADATDEEFVAVLLRRLAPEQLTVVVSTGVEPLVEPAGPDSVSLPQTLSRCARRLVAEPAAGEPAADKQIPPGGFADQTLLTGLDSAAIVELARAYVAAECLGDDPRQHAAYRHVADADRVGLHDERRRQLLACGEPSLLLGAVPFHAECAARPTDEVAALLRNAQLHCKTRGLYHAAVELGERARAMVDRDTDPDLWWEITGDVTTSLSAAGRAEEAEQWYDEARALSIDPAVHMHAAYGTAMLYARHYGDGRRDSGRARRWLNQAIAIASLLPDPKERAFQSVFQRNGLALVETRDGRPEEALRLLNEGMAWLDRDLAPDEQLLHRTGLRYNRAQVYGMMGRLEEALADHSWVIELDPNFADHYFNRGNVLRRLGRNEAALADYEQALLLFPPSPEVHYNRGDVRLELGDVEGALADFDRVLELDPEHVDALSNRAAIRCDLGDVDGAWEDIGAGLALAAGHPYLLSLRARVLAERGDPTAARQAVDAALAAGGDLAEPWAIRGGLRYEAGDLAGALDDFDRAIEIADGVEFRYNRAVVHQSAGRWAAAAADFRAILTVVDDEDAAAELDRCEAALAARVGV